MSVEIPDSAWDAVVAAVPIGAVNAAKNSAWDINELQERAVRAAAPLIVAVELERLADERWNRNSVGVADLRHWLRDRAAELRGVSVNE